MKYRPVIIIGAPRSGTNMLRDVLARLPGFATWPCDEINYVWRHGNARYPSDIFPEELATPRASAYIRKRFEDLARSSGAGTVVEKTCANSLRIGFVDRILPEAQYLFIMRNGLDVVSSAAQRWKAPLDPGYILRKARYVPLSDLPYYGLRYLGNRLHRLASPDNKLAFWGPAMNDMQAVLQQHSLLEVCALQWQECVERAVRSFEMMPPGKVFSFKYEDFVVNPEGYLQDICDFLHAPAIGAEQLSRAVEGVTVANIGKGVNRLAADEQNNISTLIGSTLHRYYPHG